jgi:hypothetical protein
MGLSFEWVRKKLIDTSGANVTITNFSQFLAEQLAFLFKKNNVETQWYESKTPIFLRKLFLNYNM